MRYNERPPNWDPVIRGRKMSELVPDELRILVNRYKRKAIICRENKVTDRFGRLAEVRWKALANAALYWLEQSRERTKGGATSRPE